MEICFSFALIAEAMAAMALAPQIPVPEDIRSEVFWSTPRILPIVKPKKSVKTTKIIT